MKLAKINEDTIIQYTCSDCGEMIEEADYGTNSCTVCKEPISKNDEFYCLKNSGYNNNDGMFHCHKKCLNKIQGIGQK